MFSEQESLQDSEARKAQYKPSEPKFNSEMHLFRMEPAIWILTLGTAQGVHDRNFISVSLNGLASPHGWCPYSCRAVTWLWTWELPGCKAQGWIAVVSGHSTCIHLALVLSGETAKHFILSLSCSDSVNEVTKSPVLNPLEAIFSLVLYSYMQLRFENHWVWSLGYEWIPDILFL